MNKKEMTKALLTQLEAAVEVFRSSKFESSHSVDVSYSESTLPEGSTLRLTWDVESQVLQVAGPFDLSVEYANILKLQGTYLGVLLAVAKILPNFYQVCFTNEQIQKDEFNYATKSLTNFLNATKLK